MQHVIETDHGQISIAESTGKGPVVLFIHGNSSCKEVFKHQVSGSIGGNYRCLFMDLPGHGASADAIDPELTYHIPGYADAALQALSILHSGGFSVVGWSLGGHIGIEMLALTNRVQALLISGTPPMSRDAKEMQDAFLPHEHMGFTGQENLTEEQVKAYAHTTCGTRHYEDFLSEAVRRTDGRARRIMMEQAIQGRGSDQRQTIETNPTPIAVLNGREEALVNNDYLASLSFANLWRDRVFRLDHAGHAPFWDEPEVFNNLLEQFLAEVT